MTAVRCWCVLGTRSRCNAHFYCAHWPNRDSGCLFCRMADEAEELERRAHLRKTADLRSSMAEQARARVRERQGKKDGSEPLYGIVQDVLHAAGVADVQCGYRAPGVVRVHAAGLLGRALRDDEVCEVLERAEKALKAAGGWRAGVRWQDDPPVLFAAKIPARVGFGF